MATRVLIPWNLSNSIRILTAGRKRQKGMPFPVSLLQEKKEMSKAKPVGWFYCLSGSDSYLQVAILGR